MPMYAWACKVCGLQFDSFWKMADKPKEEICPDCQGTATQQVTHCAVLGEEAAWLESVKTVVDKDGGEHCQRFLEDPSRANYKRWMAGEKIRPLEPGEPVGRHPKPSKSQRIKELADGAMKKLHEARKVEVKP